MEMSDHKIRKVAFLIHRQREDAKEAAKRTAELFNREGICVSVPEKESNEFDLVMTFGGDGTLLKGAKTAVLSGCPLLGINLGTVGFLTEGEAGELPEMVKRVISGEYETERRDLLEVCVNEEESRRFALNDVVLTRGGFSRLIQVETTIDGEYWNTFTADGVIAATPTGSTGYSLSAGGPVIAPGVPCTVITPVCAHSFQHSPCVVPGKSQITFLLKEEREQFADLQLDGQNICLLKSGDLVSMTLAEQSVQLVRMRPYRFFDVLRTKISDWR